MSNYKDRPDHEDADLILKLYDLRREPVMRESRNAILGKFWPKSYEEFVAITKMDHPLNAAFRQTSSYWEMAYGFARHGVVNADFLVENCGEGLFLFAKVLPYLEELRNISPTAFRNAQWIVENSEVGKLRFAMIQKRVEQLRQEAAK